LQYHVSLGTSARVITVITALLMIGIPIAILIFMPLMVFSMAILALIVPPLILLGCYWYRVTGYQVDANRITINRLASDVDIPLGKVESIDFDPEAMKRSLKSFGNGGVFGFYGKFWNRKYGRYRAYVTDLNKVVVIRAGGTIYMLSPEQPEKFIDKIKEKLSGGRN